MAKKTIKVMEVRKRINDFLLNTKNEMVAERLSMGFFLEEILHDTDNYNGFGYLDKHNMKESKEGTTVGINNQSLEQSEWFKNTDRSRVLYF